jgi:hypothetical protein
MSDSTAIGIAGVARAMAEQMRETDEDRAIQAGIARTMRDVIRDRCPTAQQPMPTVSVANAPRVVDADAPRGTGWRDPAPLASPSAPGSSTERAIAALTDHALGPAVPKAPDAA